MCEKASMDRERSSRCLIILKTCSWIAVGLLDCVQSRAVMSFFFFFSFFLCEGRMTSSVKTFWKTKLWETLLRLSSSPSVSQALLGELREIFGAFVVRHPLPRSETKLRFHPVCPDCPAANQHIEVVRTDAEVFTSGFVTKVTIQRDWTVVNL